MRAKEEHLPDERRAPNQTDRSPSQAAFKRDWERGGTVRQDAQTGAELWLTGKRQKYGQPEPWNAINLLERFVERLRRYRPTKRQRSTSCVRPRRLWLGVFFFFLLHKRILQTQNFGAATDTDTDDECISLASWNQLLSTSSNQPQLRLNQQQQKQHQQPTASNPRGKSEISLGERREPACPRQIDIISQAHKHKVGLQSRLLIPLQPHPHPHPQLRTLPHRQYYPLPPESRPVRTGVAIPSHPSHLAHSSLSHKSFITSNSSLGTRPLACFFLPPLSAPHRHTASSATIKPSRY